MWCHCCTTVKKKKRWSGCLAERLYHVALLWSRKFNDENSTLWTAPHPTNTITAPRQLGWHTNSSLAWTGETCRGGWDCEFFLGHRTAPRSQLFRLSCLSVILFLSGSEARFIVSVSCEPVVCLHSLSPLCQALTDKASTGANLPSSAPLAVPGLHSTTN